MLSDTTIPYLTCTNITSLLLHATVSSLVCEGPLATQSSVATQSSLATQSSAATQSELY